MKNKSNIIVIEGPTGSGKTDIAVKLCKSINGEIISADSRQIYRHLDIGTNKSGKWSEDTKTRIDSSIHQHLTDFLEPSEEFSAGGFVKKAILLIESIRAKGKTPVIVGGTGLYIKALIDGLAPMPKADQSIRDELHQKVLKEGKDSLYNDLKSFDPESAEKNKGNTQRLIRAIEVYKLTGKPITILQKETVPSKESFLRFAVLWEKDKLYKRLDERCDLMLSTGMIEETKKAVDLGFTKQSPGLNSLGYRLIIDHLNNKISIDEIKPLFKRDMRHYAKRQMTWLKRDKRINWIPNDISTEKLLELMQNK